MPDGAEALLRLSGGRDAVGAPGYVVRALNGAARPAIPPGANPRDDVTSQFPTSTKCCWH